MDGISVEDLCDNYRFFELFNPGAVDRISNFRMCAPVAYYMLTVLIFGLIGIVGYFLIRKLIGSHRILHLGILTITALVWVWGIFLFLRVVHIVPDHSLELSSEALPADMQELAESYLKNQVGDERFEDYFSLAPGRHIKQEMGYTVAYNFLPLADVTPSESTINVNIRGGAVQYANMVPNCVQDATLCDFNVTGEQALQIARENGFDAQDLRLSWSPFVPSSSLPLAIRITSCTANNAMYIDYRDGTVIDFVPEIICGGTP